MKPGTIRCNGGTVYTYSQSGNTYECYPKKWLVQINPRYLIPKFRKEFRYSIYLNGRKKGYGEHRCGCPPLPKFYRKGYPMYNFLRKYFGYRCGRLERDWCYIKAGKAKLVALIHDFDNGNVFCELYPIHSDTLIAKIIFFKDRDWVQPIAYVQGAWGTIHIALSYLANLVVVNKNAKAVRADLQIKYV